MRADKLAAETETLYERAFYDIVIEPLLHLLTEKELKLLDDYLQRGRTNAKTEQLLERLRFYAENITAAELELLERQPEFHNLSIRVRLDALYSETASDSNAASAAKSTSTDAGKCDNSSG